MFSRLTQHNLFGAHGREKVADRQRESLAGQRVQNAIGVSPLSDETCLTQNAQVAGDRRPGGLELRGNLAGCQLAIFEVLQNLTTGGMGEG